MRSRIFVINTCDKTIKIENLIFPPWREKTFVLELNSMLFQKIRGKRNLKVGSTSDRLKKYFEVAEKKNNMRVKSKRKREMSPLVSIVTPCYNGQSYLHGYFQAMLRQTYRNFELIFINDCSTDKTKVIAENYKLKLEARGSIVKVINLPKNLGVSGAINAGLKRFTGDYLMFLDSDDILYSNHIKRKVEFLERNKQYAWLSCRIDKMKNSKKIGVLQTFHETESENLFERFVLNRKVCYNPLLYLYRTSCFLKVNPLRRINPTRDGQNWQLLFPMAYHYDCAFIDEILGAYIVRPDSLSRTVNRPHIMDMTDRREKLLTVAINSVNDMSDKERYLNMAKRVYRKTKVMLIGGTGTLSRDVTKQCIESGIEVYMINRGRRKTPEKVHVIIGDINTIPVEKLGAMKFDAVVDFLAYTPKQLRKHLELFRDRCEHYVLISSATVYSNAKSRALITEDKPATNMAWSYSRNKIESEAVLKESYSIAAKYYTIVRPYITYGDTRIPYPFIAKTKQWTLVDSLINDEIIPVWDSSLHTLTHTEDFARALVGLFNNEKAENQTFHITSDERITWHQALISIGKAIGKTPNTIRISPEEIEKTFPTLKDELTCDKARMRVFDNSKVKNAVPGWECRIGFEEGIKRTIQYYQNAPELRGINIAWRKKTNEMLAKIKEEC